MVIPEDYVKEGAIQFQNSTLSLPSCQICDMRIKCLQGESNVKCK